MWEKSLVRNWKIYSRSQCMRAIREGALIWHEKSNRTRKTKKKLEVSSSRKKVSCARFLVWCYPECRRQRRVGAICDCIGKPSPSQHRTQKKIIHKNDHQFANWTQSLVTIWYFFSSSFHFVNTSSRSWVHCSNSSLLFVRLDGTLSVSLSCELDIYKKKKKKFFKFISWHSRDLIFFCY